MGALSGVMGGGALSRVMRCWGTVGSNEGCGGTVGSNEWRGGGLNNFSKIYIIEPGIILTSAQVA